MDPKTNQEIYKPKFDQVRASDKQLRNLINEFDLMNSKRCLTPRVRHENTGDMD